MKSSQIKNVNLKTRAETFKKWSGLFANLSKLFNDQKGHIKAMAALVGNGNEKKVTKANIAKAEKIYEKIKNNVKIYEKPLKEFRQFDPITYSVVFLFKQTTGENLTIDYLFPHANDKK